MPGTSNCAPPSIIVKFLTLVRSFHFSVDRVLLLYQGLVPYILIILTASGAIWEFVKIALFFILKLYRLNTVVLIYKTSLSLISIQRKRDLIIN